MPGIQDFLQAINPGNAFGSGQDQIGLADILAAIGGVAGPVLAARGGRIGMPLGFGLGAVGELGATLADRKQRSHQGQQTYESLRGMLPLIKDKVPGAEGMLEGVRTGAITTDEFLKHVEANMKPAHQFEPQFFMNDKGVGQWVQPGETPPAGFTPKDIFKSGEQKKEDEARRFEQQKELKDIGFENSKALKEVGASLAAANRQPREGSFAPLYDKDGNIIGKWDAHTGAPTLFSAPVAASKTSPRAGKKAVSDEDVDAYTKDHPMTAGHPTTREEAKEALAEGVSRARAKGSAEGRGPKDKGKADYFLPDGTPVYSKDLKAFGGKLPKGAIKASDFGKAPTSKGGKPQFTNVAGEKIGINPISGLPFAAGAATGAPGGIAGFLGGGSKPPKPPEVVRMVLKMAAGLTGNQVVQEKNPEGKPGYSIIGKDGVKYWLTPDANFEP